MTCVDRLAVEIAPRRQPILREVAERMRRRPNMPDESESQDQRSRDPREQPDGPQWSGHGQRRGGIHPATLDYGKPFRKSARISRLCHAQQLFHPNAFCRVVAAATLARHNAWTISREDTPHATFPSLPDAPLLDS